VWRDTGTGALRYIYDGLQRLIGAAELPGKSYAYDYDAAGNLTSITTNGAPSTRAYNAGNLTSITTYAYDNAGNLLDDGTTTYTYDALGRMRQRGSTTYTYNGDGALVYDDATRYTQDLATPLSQVLQTTQGSATTISTL